jgi:type IV secretion system protein VirB10
MIVDQKRKNSRPPPAMMIGCVTLAALMGLGGLWFIFGKEDASAALPVPAEGEKLFVQGAAKSAELRSAASGLQQKPVGEGYEFDADGRLLGAVTDDADLPTNRTLAQLSTDGHSDSSDEIRAGVRHRPRQSDVVSSQACWGESNNRREREAVDRGLLTQSMLAYSTVDSAGWAERRPESSPRGDGSVRPATGAREVREDAEKQSDERVTRVLERLQEGMLAEVADNGPAPANRRSDGHALYPAAGSPQAFGRGAIGDMRITPGPEAIVRQGKFLDCALVNQLRVDLAESPVIAMVTRNFLTADGGQVLVPAGAKLLGTAGTVQSVQQARVYIKFDRVIYPDQRSAYFPVRQVGAVDGAGAVGIPGDVARHIVLQFGAAIMLGVLDGLAAAALTPATVTAPTPGNLVVGQASSAFAGVVGGVLQRYANVVPTISVPPGSRMKVFFAEDVRMSVYMRSSELSWMR